MKLQRKNKYSKRITAGLIALLISASLLAGCVEDEAVDESAVVVEETEEPVKETPLIKDENYYLNYYKLSDEEVEKELENYEFKYPNATWRMNQINTVTLLDEFHEYKVLQVIQRPDEKNNLIHIYDLFTEEHLFDIPYVEQNILINTDFVNWDLTKISNKIPYFDDKYIISMGICISSCLFVTNNLFALSQKDNINYLDPGFAPASILYPESFNDGDLHFNVQDIAKAYIKAVPKEIRVNTKKLGVTPTYREEDKYQDYWKINEDEIQLRLEKFKIASPDKSLKANVAKTLALKDANDCYKILNVIIQENGDMQEFYDLYSGLYLFSIVNNRDNTFDVYDGYTGYKFDSIINMIPFFEDKAIVKLDALSKTNYFIPEHIDELRKKDGIEYNSPDEELLYILYPVGDYSTADINHTIKEYARVLVISLPEEMQVTYKELTEGLELEHAKVMTK